MQIQARVTINHTQPAPVLLRARKYGEPVMVELMGLDTGAMGTSNFQNVALFTERGGFGAVSQFQRLDRAALQRLVDLQLKDAATLNQKMAFLCGERVGPPDRPYWTRGGEWLDLYNGNTSILFEFGTIVFGGQMVQVESKDGKPVEYNFFARYQNKTTTEWISFYKPIGLTKSDWTRSTTDLLSNGLLQVGTWADYPHNGYHNQWHGGTVLHPVWSQVDYPSNNGTLYIAKEFLEPL